MKPLCSLLILLCTAGVSHAQDTNFEWRGGQVEPKAVEIPLYAGAPLEKVLDALNTKGFNIGYTSDLVLPAMKLTEKPKATRIDTLLKEILAPWDLRADRLANGRWLVVPKKRKKPKD